MLDRLKTQLAETKDIIKKRLDRPKDKYERPVRSKLKIIRRGHGRRLAYQPSRITITTPSS